MPPPRMPGRRGGGAPCLAIVVSPAVARINVTVMVRNTCRRRMRHGMPALRRAGCLLRALPWHHFSGQTSQQLDRVERGPVACLVDVRRPVVHARAAGSCSMAESSPSIGWSAIQKSAWISCGLGIVLLQAVVDLQRREPFDRRLQHVGHGRDVQQVARALDGILHLAGRPVWQPRVQGLKLLRDLGFRLFVLARDRRHDTRVWRQPAEVNLACRCLRAWSSASPTHARDGGWRWRPPPA